MHDRDQQLRGDERGRHRRIDVADHDDDVRAICGELGLEAQHDAGGLLRASARADFEVHIGACDGELAEEHLVHRHVVMLARVNEPDAEPAVVVKRPHDGRDLDEIRPRAHDAVHTPSGRCRHGIRLVSLPEQAAIEDRGLSRHLAMFQGTSAKRAMSKSVAPRRSGPVRTSVARGQAAMVGVAPLCAVSIYRLSYAA